MKWDFLTQPGFLALTFGALCVAGVTRIMRKQFTSANSDNGNIDVRGCNPLALLWAFGAEIVSNILFFGIWYGYGVWALATSIITVCLTLLTVMAVRHFSH